MCPYLFSYNFKYTDYIKHKILLKNIYMINIMSFKFFFTKPKRTYNNQHLECG